MQTEEQESGLQIYSSNIKSGNQNGTQQDAGAAAFDVAQCTQKFNQSGCQDPCANNESKLLVVDQEQHSILDSVVVVDENCKDNSNAMVDFSPGKLKTCMIDTTEYRLRRNQEI